MSVFATGVGTKYLRRPLQGNIGNEPVSMSCWIKGTPGNGLIWSWVTGGLFVGFDWFGSSIVAEYNDGVGSNRIAMTSPTMGASLPAWTQFGLVLNGPSPLVPYWNGTPGGWVTTQANAGSTTGNMLEVAVGGYAGGYSPPAALQ